jgi:hypothetical protein
LDYKVLTLLTLLTLLILLTLLTLLTVCVEDLKTGDVVLDYKVPTLLTV